MDRITTESRPVDIVGVDSRFRHVYLVFQDDDGTETVITGGPQHNNPFDFGDIVVDAGGLLANSDSARGHDTPADRGSVEIALGARDAADVWAVMLQQAHNIDHADRDYQPFSDNSNAVATTVLHAVGIDIDQVLPHHVNSGNAPGLSEEIAFDTTLFGGARADVLSGWSGDDTLQGGGGNDRIRGFDGSDVIGGGSGDDLIFGDAGNDRLSGGAGADQVRGQAGADQIYGGAGDDDLQGGAGPDEIRGQAGNDILAGGAGADHLHGGAGDDQLIGGPGADLLEGGAGPDRFIYQSIADGTDVIQDFHTRDVQTGAPGDVLDVSDLLRGFDPASSDPDAFVRLSAQGNDTGVAVSPDGHANDAVPLVTLAGVSGLAVDQLIADGNLAVAPPTG